MRYASMAIHLRGWIGPAAAGGWSFEDTDLACIELPAVSRPEAAAALSRWGLPATRTRPSASCGRSARWRSAVWLVDLPTVPAQRRQAWPLTSGAARRRRALQHAIGPAGVSWAATPQRLAFATSGTPSR